MKLPLLKYSKHNFSFDFFQKQHIYPFYNKLINNINLEEVINKEFKSEYALKNVIHEVKFIPTYLRIETSLLCPKYEIIKYHRVKNFRINLDGLNNAEGYIQRQMSSKSRSQLRSRIRRLETCFNIKYTFYYGNITKDKYDYLFKTMELLIKRRFNQRGDIYSQKDKWDFIKENAYELILEKKASFFVIYDENKPIDICLNYHFQNIMQASIRSYDIDYSKFWIGQIDLYKQIDWCITNNIKIYDLMWGELDYKMRWSNEISIFEHHFIFKNNHLLKAPIVKTLIKLYKIKDNIIEKSYFSSFFKTKIKLIKNIKSKLEKKDSVFLFENINTSPCIEDVTVININNDKYKFLRKAVFDFQYLNSENSAAIIVYKINNETNGYIIKGEKQQSKISINR